MKKQNEEKFFGTSRESHSLEQNSACMCEECSLCCNNKSVPLTPRDVFSIALEKGLATKDVVDNFCDITYTDNFPTLYLKQKKQGCCILSEEDKCGLKRKPNSCKDNASGICLWFGKENDNNSPVQKLAFDNLLETDVFFGRWLQCVAITELLMNKRKENVDGAYNTIINVLYCNYDMDTPFLKQFDAKSLELTGILGKNLSF